MPPSAEEAALALREIAAIRERAAGFQDYRAESSQLLVWGCAYIIGFTLAFAVPGVAVAASALAAQAERLVQV